MKKILYVLFICLSFCGVKLDAMLKRYARAFTPGIVIAQNVRGFFDHGQKPWCSANPTRALSAKNLHNPGMLLTPDDVEFKDNMQILPVEPLRQSRFMEVAFVYKQLIDALSNSCSYDAFGCKVYNVSSIDDGRFLELLTGLFYQDGIKCRSSNVSTDIFDEQSGAVKTYDSAAYIYFSDPEENSLPSYFYTDFESFINERYGNWVCSHEKNGLIFFTAQDNHSLSSSAILQLLVRKCELDAKMFVSTVTSEEGCVDLCLVVKKEAIRQAKEFFGVP